MYLSILNNFTYLRNAGKNNNVSFGTGQYDLEKRMKALRAVAIELQLPCIYTGKKFGINFMPSIEHLLPKSKSSDARKFGLSSIGVLGNLVLAGRKVNTRRRSKPLKLWYKEHPEYLIKTREALEAYKKVHIPKFGIEGPEWVRRIKRTINAQLGYVTFTGKSAQKPQKLSALSYNA